MVNSRLLKAKRTLNGISQEVIASELNIHTPTYSLKENNKALFNLEEINRIKELLKLNGEEVLEIFFDE